MAGRRYLVDTNVFVEILLAQSKELICKNFITSNFTEISISQFAIQSIAIICYRNKLMPLFTKFITDIFDHIEVSTLDNKALKDVENIIATSNLDYDDAYQLKSALINNLEIVTLDQDFLKVAATYKILFL